MEVPELPLAGVRILDFTDEAGVFATRLLADLGADVVRLETSNADAIRSRGPFLKATQSVDGSLAHLLYNAGKRSVASDPDTPAGWEVVDRIFGWADLVITPITKTDRVRRVLDPASLAERHPHLAVVDMVFRRDAPDLPGSDLTGVASGGLLWLNGFPGDPPNYPAGRLGYKQASLVATFSALALLRARSRGGATRRVTVSLQEALTSTTIQSGNQNVWMWERRSPGRTGGSAAGTPSVFQTSDGAWVSFVVPPPYWNAFAEWVHEALGDGTFLGDDWRDPAFRVGKGELVGAAIIALCAKLPGRDLVDTGQRRHLLVCPVNTVVDLAKDEHLRARGFYQEVEQPPLGRTVTLPVSAFRPGGVPIHARPAPSLGQHTSEVLKEAADLASKPAPSPSPAPTHDLPLQGLRVLDFCWLIAGPLGTRLLADLGAEVIKVESSARMDRIREGMVSPPGGSTINTAPVFNDCNTNKKSIALNLGTPKGIEIAKRLAAQADIVTSNFTPDRMDRWGLGYDALRAIKPDLIVASMPVMGREGPHNFWGAYGNGVIAMSGISSLTGFPDRPPVGLGPLHSDFTAPYFLAIHVMAALHQRERTGTGQFIEMAQYETAVSLLDTELVEHLNNGDEPQRSGNRSRSEAPHGVFRAAGDDAWVAISVPDDARWLTLCAAMHRPDLAARSDLATLAGRRAHEDEIEAALSAWTTPLAAHYIVGSLVAAGIPVSPVQRIQDLVETDPGMAGFFVPLEHPECGSILTQNEPVLWGAERLPLRRAPLFGEHTHEVLTGLLGIDDREFTELVASGVLS
jgi:crotonobetainyl-CoA:carnitine CoA-transferase CaiB-like acyl-CoA transferase